MLKVDPATLMQIQELHTALFAIAPKLIRSARNQPSDAREFAACPDDPRYHNPYWHQYGILTHSRRFQEQLEGTVVSLLRQWRLDKAVDTALSEMIDGQSKWQLLHIAAILHDVGKFTARKPKKLRPGGIPVPWHFGGHEADSGRLIRSGIVHELVAQQGFTPAQIEYLASCAERHFRLGVLRNQLKTSSGFTLAFAHSSALKEAAIAIINSDEDQAFALEIFLCFLADNLSKVDEDLWITADSDASIIEQKDTVLAKLQARNLPSELVEMCLQMPVNVAVAHKALLYWIE